MNWLKRLFEEWFRAKVVKAPEVKPVEKPAEKPVAPSKPAIITDDPSCEIVIKCGGREILNVGQVTYIKRYVTANMFDGQSCVCVQYNDASVADGERTVFKDKSRTGVWSGQLPLSPDIPINKVVVWYE